ncbi:aldo/keto reductase family protein [Microcella alkaliphila]|uniref:Aldo/keto reductase family protein n=1 Tax=Microcella alkaliphila TaxID=279828 RepID=A0A4Q7TGF4_9MICO|nr:aldo/keto reductase family protein [Microcella alkaliphila]
MVAAAVEAGAVALDTARAYASVEDDAVGERLTADARSLRDVLPVVTEAGQYRVSTSSRFTDGSASRLRADALRSAQILGAPPELLLLHRADRIDDLDESVRTLAALRDEGVVRAIGLSNTSVELIDQTAAVTRIDTVQNRLGLGVNSFAECHRCPAIGIDFFAYAPFGGPVQRRSSRACFASQPSPSHGASRCTDSGSRACSIPCRTCGRSPARRLPRRLGFARRAPDTVELAGSSCSCAAYVAPIELAGVSEGGLRLAMRCSC